MRSLPLPVPHFLCVGCLLAVGCSDDNQNTPNYATDAPSDGGPTAGTTTTAPSTSSTVGTTGLAPATTRGVTAVTGGGGASANANTSSATSSLGPTSGAATDGSSPGGPVDCSAIGEHSDWELCESGTDFCSAVFRDGAGCGAVCASVGLTCAEAWEDADGSCAPDTSRAALSCSAESEHESDYCLCRGPGSAGSTTSSTTGAAVTNTTGSNSGGDGGTGGTGGASSTDSGSTSDSTSGGGTGGTGSTENPGCEDVMGDAGTVDSTIVVASGETFDGQCRRYRAGAALGDGSQDENQDPVFRLEDGARLINVVLGSPAADGIHTYGDVTLENIVWEDIGEDAMTIKETGTVVLDGGGAFNGEDKVFQINAPSTFRVSNFTARSAGKFIRQNGDTTFRVDVFIDNCDISQMDEAIFRTDSSSSTVSMTNTRYSEIGDELFIGVSAGNITESGNTEY